MPPDSFLGIGLRSVACEVHKVKPTRRTGTERLLYLAARCTLSDDEQLARDMAQEVAEKSYDVLARYRMGLHPEVEPLVARLTVRFVARNRPASDGADHGVQLHPNSVLPPHLFLRIPNVRPQNSQMQRGLGIPVTAIQVLPRRAEADLRPEGTPDEFDERNCEGATCDVRFRLLRWKDSAKKRLVALRDMKRSLHQGHQAQRKYQPLVWSSL